MNQPITLRLLGLVAGSKIPNTYFTDYTERRIMPHKQYAVMAVNGVPLKLTQPDQYITIRRIRNLKGDPLNFIAGRTIATIDFLFKPVALIGLPEMDQWDNSVEGVMLELKDLEAD